MKDLFSFMRGLLSPSSAFPAVCPKYTHYRKFIILDTSLISHRHANYQRKVESYRPQVDYIVLPTNQLLIGFTEDYSELTKAAIELSMQHVLETQRKTLSAYQHLSSICSIYKDNTPYATKYPELFI